MSFKSFVVQVLIEAKNKAGPAFSSFKKGFEGALRVPTSLNQAMDLMGNTLGNIVNQIPQLVSEMAQLGIASEGATRRFTQFAGSSDRAASLLDAFNVATDGTVDKISAMTSAGRLLQMGLVANETEMANVASIATKLGDQTAGASDRISDFALLLANQSIPRLDNFGISSGKVRKRIKELQASIKDLSREEAFKIAVMEEGAKALEILGDTSDLASVKIDKVKASVKDAKTGIGELIVESLDAAGGVDELAARIRMLPETISQVVMLLDAYSAGAQAAGGNIFKLGEAVDVFNGQLRANIINQNEMFQATEIVRFGYTQQREAIEGSNETLRESAEITLLSAEAQQKLVIESRKFVDSIPPGTQGIIDQTEALKKQEEALRAQTEAANSAVQSQLDLAQSLKGASEAQIASAAISELKGALDDGQISFEDYSTAVGEVQLSFGLADEASVNLSKRIGTLVTKFGSGQVSATTFDDELARLIELNTQENEQIALFGELLTITSETIATTTEVETEFSGALDRTAQDAQASREALDQRVMSIGESVQSTEELSEATDILSERIEELNTWLDELPEEKTIKIKVNIEQSGGIPASGGGVSGLPALQHGGSFRGMGIVGEGGQPELVFAPGGATVTPMRQTNNNFNMTVNTGQGSGSVIDEFEVMQALAQ